MDRPEADESVVAVVVDLLAEEAARAVVAEVALERRTPPQHPQPHVVRARRAPATVTPCKTTQNPYGSQEFPSAAEAVEEELKKPHKLSS